MNKKKETIEQKNMFPEPILKSCAALGIRMPKNTNIAFQPSHYAKKGILHGNLLEIIIRLGKNKPKIKYKELIKYFRRFRTKYKTQKNLKYTSVDLSIMFTDWLLFARPKGFSHNCYFDYELYNKEFKARDTFLNEGFRTFIYENCSSSGYRSYLLDKGKFNTKFKWWVNREWLDMTTASEKRFKEFIKHQPIFFAKPIKGTGGKGARVIDSNEFTFNELYELCKNEELIVEEIVKQDKKLAKINSSTLNTVRVVTFLASNNKPIIIAATARFGRMGKDVDNFHGGGVAAVVNVETGIIESKAMNRSHIKDAYHPDSNEKIEGFKYPHWDEVRQAVCDAALLLPQMRNIGWDVTVTEEGKVEFIEGNGKPNFDILQSPDQIGKRALYDPYFSEYLKSKGIIEKEPQKLNTEIIPYKRTFVKRVLLKLIKIFISLKRKHKNKK